LLNDIIPKDLSEYSDDAKDVALEVLNAFVDTFSVKMVDDKHTQENKKFYISWSDTDEQGMYISPREYTTMFQEMVAGIEDAVDENKGIHDVEELVKPVTAELDKSIESTLSWIMDKQDIDSPQFLNSVKDWLEGKTREIILKAFTKKRASASLAGILAGVLEDRPNANLKDDGDFINYINNFQLNQFTEDFNNFLVDLIDQKKEKLAMLTAKTHNAKVLMDDRVKMLEETVNELVYIVREVVIACKIHKLDFTVLEKVQEVMKDGIWHIIEEQEKEEEIPSDVFTGLLEPIFNLHNEFDDGR
jgi:hypothetical protein